MRRRSFLLTAAGAALPAASSAQTAKPRLPRRDCFFGIHLDLHANDRDTALGRDLSDDMVAGFLAKVKPDYVQYDCKGHVGWLAYPSKVSNSAPNIVKDSLEIWRRGTAKEGVGLYIHFSGVWDSLAIKQRPEWAVVRADGARDPNATSLFSAYADERMIPQLLEASEKYDLDGAWIDGECWATRPDYGEKAAAAFRAATGISTLPKSASDPGWAEFLEFHRESFRKYLRHYLDVLHRERPKFQVASNWMYTTYVPEKPDIPVDYISGDYLGNASISTARLETRYLCNVGKPWDLMAWGFQRGSEKLGHSHKSAVALQQEASVVLAQGGGFQIYYQPTRFGWLDDRHVGVMAKVGQFCRARQRLSHKTETVPQIGVILSKTSLYATSNKLFGGWGSHTDPGRGFVDVLVDNQYSVDVIPEWRIAELAAKYPLVVLPDWPKNGDAIREPLLDYARKGGTLLVAGAANAAIFADTLGVSLKGAPAEFRGVVAGREMFGSVQGLWQDVDPGGGEALAHRFATYDSRQNAIIAATVAKLGAGRIAAVYGPIGSIYAISHGAAVRTWANAIVEKLFNPMFRLTGPPTVEASLRRKNGRLLLHLVNCTAMQVADAYVAGDFVPAVGPLTLSIRLPQAPAKVTLEPGGATLTGKYDGKRWTGTIPRLDVHRVVAFG